MTSQEQEEAPPQPTLILGTCVTCAHFKVCWLYRAVVPLLNSWTEKTKPFEPGELARICRHYAGISA